MLLTLVLWQDQALLHGRRMAEPEVSRKTLWRAALEAASARWFVSAFLFAIVFLRTGRTGAWMILSLVSFAAFWLEGFAAALSLRMRHPLAGATFLGLVWSWLWTVFLPY